MGNDKIVVKQGGIGLGTICFLASLIFAILKAVGVIGWSWWIVAAPALGYIALSIAITIFVLIIVGIVLLVAALASR